ncbi:MAG: DUF1795 domain-containing protein [Anaerolineae bacterium]|jgi:hypothetical protein|nr:DUF1795 domain-containing protein [Anaerolineae bacterium]
MKPVLRLSLLLVLCLVAVLPAGAQAGDGAWQPLQNGALSLRVPPDWQPVPGLTGSSGATAPLAGAGLLFGTTLLPAGATPQTVAAALTDTVPANMPIPLALPAGDAFRLEWQAMVDGVTMQMVLYGLLLENTLISLTGRVPAAAPQAADYLILFERSARTLTIADPRATPWPRVSDAAGVVSLQLPPGWQPAPTGARVLTVIDPQNRRVVTVNYRPLAQPATLEELAQRTLNAYPAQGVPVAAFAPLALPVGAAYQATLPGLPAQAADGTLFAADQLQVLVLRGSTLLIINAGCPAPQFAECRPLLETVLDTLTLAD